MTTMKIKKRSQQYIKKLISKHPNICSGRKNFDAHYDRVIKNVILTKMFMSPDKKKFSKIINQKI